MQLDYIFFIKIGFGALVIIVGYFIVSRIVDRLIKRMEPHLPSDMHGIVRYALHYGLYTVCIVISLQSIGIDLSALLTAAGIAGVAVGFAAQTTLSNIISGIILLIERLFKQGDLIICNTIQGRVSYTGLLSTVLKTADNRFVRIPNEHLIKSNVINLSESNIRCIAFIANIKNQDNPTKIFDMISHIGKNFTYRLSEKPLEIFFDAFSNDIICITIQIWVSAQEVTIAKSTFIKTCADTAQAQNLQFYIASKDC